MTESNAAETLGGGLARVPRNPLLADFHEPLPRLSASGSADLPATFARLAELVGPAAQQVTVSFQVSDGTEVLTRCLTAGPAGGAVSESTGGQPDVEILLDAATWREMADGHLSPLAAFGRGRMRVRGDINAARRFVRTLRRPPAPGP